MKVLLLLALTQWGASSPIQGDLNLALTDNAVQNLISGSSGDKEDPKRWQDVIPKMKDSAVLFSSESIDSLLVHPVIELKRNIDILTLIFDVEQEMSFVIRNPLGNDTGIAVENQTESRDPWLLLLKVKDSTGNVALKVNSTSL